MTTYYFKAQALTPIHIGCGCEIDPTEFLIKGDRLIHFNVARLVGDLSQEDKERFVALTDRADLKDIQNFLRHHMDTERHGLTSIDAAAGFRDEYTVKASNPNNQFRVPMMPRNPHTGRVYIPGSTIKGAIRTAMVNYFTNLDPETSPVVHEYMANERNKSGKALEEKALNYYTKNTHKDIFRLIHVRDAALPDNSTRIDRARNSGAKGIQMWVERIKSRADEARPPEFTISIRMDSAAMQHPSVKEMLGRSFDINKLFDACNRFYWGRMVAEGDRFDGRASNGQSWKAIEKTFPLGQIDNKSVISINPTTPFWSSPDYVNRRMLLRVGHFSHFESLSVDELRRGWNIRKKEPITDMGSTRTRCVMEKGGHDMPFGWLMLTLDQENSVWDY